MGGGQDPDDCQPDVVDLDPAADRGFVGEQIRDDLRTDHTDSRVIPVVPFVEKATLGDLDRLDLAMLRTDSKQDGLGRNAVPQNPPGLDLDLRTDPTHGGNRFADRLGVARRQARRALPDLVQPIAVELSRLEDDVVDAESADHLHRFPLGSGADRQHRDHRPDPEDHTQHRQRRSQLVGREIRQRRQQGFSKIHRSASRLEPGLGLEKRHDLVVARHARRPSRVPPRRRPPNPTRPPPGPARPVPARPRRPRTTLPIEPTPRSSTPD